MVENGESLLLGVNVIKVNQHENVNAVTMPKKISKVKFHQILGHEGLQYLTPTLAIFETYSKYLTPTAKYLNVELAGTVKKCVSCAIEKIRQASIPKENENKSKVAGE